MAIANVTQSLASTLLRLLLINPPKMAELIGKLNAGQALPAVNGFHFPPGTRGGLNTPFGLSVATTPFRILIAGSRKFTCATAVWQNRTLNVFLSHSCASFVR